MRISDRTGMAITGAVLFVLGLPVMFWVVTGFALHFLDGGQ